MALEDGRGEVTRADIAAALAAADVPVLLMVLVHLTGERKWIEPPYQPGRDPSFFADESGGLPKDVQARVRAAALDVLSDYFAGRLKPPRAPDEDMFLEMMSVCVGEPIPAEYLVMMLEEMGLRERDPQWRARPNSESLEKHHVLIIGAGVSGLCAAIKLKQAGIPYTIVEKNPQLGGTWFENRYPEVGCDVPNHYYSYSFRRKADWTDYYSKGAEIEDYLLACAREFGVDDEIQFETEVLSAEYDEDNARWRVTLRLATGATHVVEAGVLVSATGQLNRPKVPNIPCMETFKGPLFHSARWPDDLSLEGKRVAVIGTGASAMQLARTTAEKAERLLLFQRSPQWAIPTRDYHRKVSAEKQWLLEHVPFYAGWYRFTLVWRFGDQLLATVRRDPDWPHPERAMNLRNDRHRDRLTAYIYEELADRPDLIKKVLPSYPPYGKRILVDNHWYRTLKRENVDLVTEDIARISPDGVVTASGQEYPADIVVLATGFETTRLLGALDIRGRGGQTLEDVWGDDDSRAHLGLTVPGFPNFFCLYGPNTNLGHGGSYIFVAECQVRYVVASLMRMVEQNIASIECRQEVFDDYNARVDKEHANMVWTHPGMDTWYRNKAGRVVSIMPWRLADYWRFTHQPNFDDYITRTTE